MWCQRAIAFVCGIATVFFPVPAAAELLRCDQCAEAQRLAQLPAPLRTPAKYLVADFSDGEVYAYLVPARSPAGAREQAPVAAINEIPEPLRAMAKRLSRLHAGSHGSMQIRVTVREEELQIPSGVIRVGHDIPEDWPARARVEHALLERGETLLARDPALQDALELWRSQKGLHSTFPGWLDTVQLDFRVQVADGAEHIFRRDWESGQIRLVAEAPTPSPTAAQ